jgi:integrase
LRNGLVEVNEIVAEAEGHLYVGAPKTAAGRRRVPMPSFVVDELARYADGGVDRDGLVFPDENGNHRRASNFRSKIWQPACKRAGLEGLVMHELRHSAVAAWIESGAEPKEIAARAGHRSVVTILDQYGHRFPSQAQRVNDNIDRLYREARAEHHDQ